MGRVGVEPSRSSALHRRRSGRPVRHLQLDLEGAGRGIGRLPTIAQPALDRLAGDQAAAPGMPDPRLADLGLGDLADDQERVVLDDRRDRSPMSTKSPISTGRSSSTPSKGAQISVWSSSIRACSSAACAASRLASAAATLVSAWKPLAPSCRAASDSISRMLERGRACSTIALRSRGSRRTSRSPASTGAPRRPPNSTTRPVVSARSSTSRAGAVLPLITISRSHRRGHHLAHPHRRRRRRAAAAAGGAAGSGAASPAPSWPDSSQPGERQHERRRRSGRRSLIRMVSRRPAPALRGRSLASAPGAGAGLVLAHVGQRGAQHGTAVARGEAHARGHRRGRRGRAASSSATRGSQLGDHLVDDRRHPLGRQEMREVHQNQELGAHLVARRRGQQLVEQHADCPAAVRL